MNPKLLDVPEPYVGRHRPDDEGGKWHVPVAAPTGYVRLPKHLKGTWPMYKDPFDPSVWMSDWSNPLPSVPADVGVFSNGSVWDRVLDDGHPPGFLGSNAAARMALERPTLDPPPFGPIRFDRYGWHDSDDDPIPPGPFFDTFDRNDSTLGAAWAQSTARFSIDSPYWRRDDDGVTTPVGKVTRVAEDDHGIMLSGDMFAAEPEHTRPSWWRRFAAWWDARLYGFLTGIGVIRDDGWVTEPNDDQEFTVEPGLQPDWLTRMFPDGLAAQLHTGDHLKMVFDHRAQVTRVYVKMQAHVMIDIGVNTEQCIECGQVDLEPDFDRDGPCWVELQGGDD